MSDTNKQQTKRASSMIDEAKDSIGKIMESAGISADVIDAIAEDSGIDMGNTKEQLESEAIKKLRPDWKNEPSFDDLNNDLTEANYSHEAFKAKLLIRKENFEGGPEIKAPKNRSTHRPKLIRKNAEWKYPAIEDPFLSTVDMYKINPRTWEDEAAAKQNEIILNYQWNTKINKVKLVNDISRCVVDEGTVIVKVGWDAEWGTKTVEKEEEQFATAEESFLTIMNQVQSGEISQEEADAMLASGQLISKGMQKVYIEEETLIKNQPSYEVCNAANVIVDPTCDGDISKATFLIHEYSTSMSDLKKNEYKKTVEITKEIDEITGFEVEVEVVTESGFYKNLGSINIDAVEFINDEYGSTSANTFRHKDKTRRKIRAYEYWGYWDINGDGKLVSIVATWIGTTMIRLEENPFPHKKIPFTIATYMPVKREIHGEADGDLLIENQESIGKMTRAALDITAQQAIGQEFIDEQLFPTPVQKSNYENGKTVFFRHGLDPRTAINRRTVEPIPNSVFNIIEMQNADAESLTGTKSFSGGIGSQALGSVAAGIRSAMDATSKRELSILRRLNQLFNDMARLTIANNQAFLSEEEVIRIANGFTTIRRDDLAGEFDLIVDVSTPEKDNDTAEKLYKLMQTNAASMDPKLAAIHYVKLADLWKLPDLARQVEEEMNKPKEPDPMQVEMMQIQLEAAKQALKNEQMKEQLLMKQMEDYDSRIHERVSRSLENDEDIRNKAAQALVREEQARKLRAETDMLDKEFAKDITGEKEAELARQEMLKQKAAQSQAEHSAMVEIDKQRLEKEFGIGKDNQSNQGENYGM